MEVRQQGYLRRALQARLINNRDEKPPGRRLSGLSDWHGAPVRR